MQHMDYDGFHQMVLGANLIPIKKGAVEMKLSSGTQWGDQITLNHQAKLSSIMTRDYEDPMEKLNPEELKKIEMSVEE